VVDDARDRLSDGRLTRKLLRERRLHATAIACPDLFDVINAQLVDAVTAPGGPGKLAEAFRALQELERRHRAAEGSGRFGRCVSACCFRDPFTEETKQTGLE
jgi:hypothetical protein